MDRIDIVSLDGIKQNACTKNSVLSRAMGGELIIIRRCLQNLEVLDSLHDLLIRNVGNVCGEAVAREVCAGGIEKIHEHLGLQQIEQVYIGTRGDLALKMPAITAQMFRQLGASDPFFVHDSSLIRLMLPYSAMQSKQQQFKKKHLGKLAIHGPHHDHYQNVPLNALNIWLAIGRVSHDNGIFIFPEIWGKNLPKGSDIVRHDQYLGRPISVELEPGDALIFHSNHMHSSCLNTTEETRVVLTNRVCLDYPQFPDITRRQKYYLSSAFPENLDLSNLFLINGFIGDKDKFLKSEDSNHLHGAADTVEVDCNNVPKESLNLKDLSPISLQSAITRLADGEISPIDPHTCVAQIDGKFYSFRRHCPHEGADLALGSISDGAIVCPHHGLRFCAETGEPNCTAVGKLKTEVLQPPETPNRQNS